MYRIIPFLILPVLALVKLAGKFDWIWIVAYTVFISLLSAGRIWQDKRSARNNGWRIPEATLHIQEFLGGWPGSYVAQQIVRHKTSKRSYRIVFWLIVTLHQIIAAEYLTGWKLLGAARSLFA